MTRLAASILAVAVTTLACASAVTPPEAAAAPPAKPPAPAPSAAPSAAPTAAPSAAPTAAPAPPPPVLPDIPKSTAVLHIGDSFALAGFAQALKPRFKALGARYEVRAETSSFTTTWSAKIDGFVANTQPDLVIINLGANEVANTDPTTHAPAVRRIVAAIGGRPCVWVSAPSWRKDTGIVEVIRQNSAPCRFFDSDKLVKEPIPRQADKIHPNEQGGAIWADAFWGWLQGQRAPLDPGADPKAKRPPWQLLPSPAGEHK